jgi:hypothetical protein
MVPHPCADLDICGSFRDSAKVPSSSQEAPWDSYWHVPEEQTLQVGRYCILAQPESSFGQQQSKLERLQVTP